MNTRTLYSVLLATALLLGAGTAQATQTVSVADSIRMQMRAASAAINADTRATVKEQGRHLDVPGVSSGPVRMVEAPYAAPASRRVLETAAVDAAAAVDHLQRDLVARAMEVPGLYGVYRYMALTAITAATVVAE